MNAYVTNQLRGYNVVLAMLQAFSEDICKDCIGLEQAEIKAEKGLKKLRLDLEASNVPDKEKGELLISIEHFAEKVRALPVAEACT
ncbi:MAG: hypothetical protein ACE5LX_03845 [Nitrospinota bacterium]